jgi:hypothetical protein
MPSLCDKTSLHLLPVGEGGSAVLAVTTTLSYPELWTAEDIAEAELRLLTSVRRSLPQLVASTKTDSVRRRIPHHRFSLASPFYASGLLIACLIPLPFLFAFFRTCWATRRASQPRL